MAGNKGRKGMLSAQALVQSKDMDKKVMVVMVQECCWWRITGIMVVRKRRGPTECVPIRS